MSFFTEPKNAGIALMIVAVLNIIAGIIGIYDGATNGFNTGAVVVAVVSAAKIKSVHKKPPKIKVFVNQSVWANAFFSHSILC